MRIAQVSPLFESVPPQFYGGTERIVSSLTEELVRLGHDVTLFASGDSVTTAHLIPTGDQALRLAGSRETYAPHALMFEKVRYLAHRFDLVHFHNETWHFGFARTLQQTMRVPSISTMHGRLDLPEYTGLFDEFTELPLVSISERQALAVPRANWVSTIHHGLDPNSIQFHREHNGYLAFIGRISPEKGVEHAVEIARRTRRKLKIAAKIELRDEDYYQKIRPLLNESFVEFVGEIGEREKSNFLGGAEALLFPITWPEPFGLVMIEALAAGTPVIAFRNGAVSEVIENGHTGFTVTSIEEAVNKVSFLPSLHRANCRSEFERRFTSRRMARDYIDVYTEILSKAALTVAAPAFSIMAKTIDRPGMC